MATHHRARDTAISKSRKRLHGTWRGRPVDARMEDLWKFFKKIMAGISTVSLDLGYHLKRRRSAKIVVLRKPGKSDYSIPEAYHPFSLLNTVSKLLEAVMARRLSYLSEKRNLLPDTQLGGRPGRDNRTGPASCHQCG